MDIYVYARNYKTGEIKEHLGEMSGRRCPGNGYFCQVKNSRKYYTGLAEVEGEVRGATVWYTEPSPDKAIIAFGEKDRQMKELYQRRADNPMYEELDIIYQDDDIPSVESEINLEEAEDENQIDG